MAREDRNNGSSNIHSALGGHLYHLALGLLCFTGGLLITDIRAEQKALRADLQALALQSATNFATYKSLLEVFQERVRNLENKRLP